MAIKQLKPKRTAPVPVYDTYDVEHGAEASGFEYQARMLIEDDIFDDSGASFALPKKVTYQSQHGGEEIGLAVRQESEYNSLEVAMTNQMGRPDYLTANVPDVEGLAYNEAYLDKVNSKFKAGFIKDNQLGVVLPQSQSGLKGYNKIVFNMDRLAEFDPVGVEEYMQQMREIGRVHEIQSEQESKSIVQDFTDGFVAGAKSQLHGQRALPSIAYDLDMVGLDGPQTESSRPLPVMGEELLAQTQAGYQSEIGPEY